MNCRRILKINQDKFRDLISTFIFGEHTLWGRLEIIVGGEQNDILLVLTNIIMRMRAKRMLREEHKYYTREWKAEGARDGDLTDCAYNNTLSLIHI